MDPTKINFIHYNCLLAVNKCGSMRQLFTPFRVKVKETSICGNCTTC